MGYSTYTPFLSIPHSPLHYHPYQKPAPPPGPVLPPIDFRRAFYPPSRSVSAESNGHYYQKRRPSSPVTPPLLETILEPLPPPRYPEIKTEPGYYGRRPSSHHSHHSGHHRMSGPQDPTAALALHFANVDQGISSMRSSNDNDIPVIPPEIRFDETLNTGADSPLDDADMSMEHGTPRQPFSRSPELRVTHKLAERKRRKEMKELFDELREHLPPERGIKSSKWEILSKSIDYVTFLKKQNADAVAEIDRLRRELDIARGGTGQYTPYTFSFTAAYPGPGTYAAAPSATTPQQPPQPTAAALHVPQQSPVGGSQHKSEQPQP